MTAKAQIAIVAKKIKSEVLDCIENNFDNKILIITPDNYIHHNNKIEVINDNYFLDKVNFLNNCKHPRPNWLYQQFLKYYIVLKSEYENTLIIDGDSILTNPKFLKNNIFYYSQKKIESKYNKFIASKIGKEYCISNNFITNQMLFNKSSLKIMLDKYFSTADNFHIPIIKFLTTNSHCEFSEYQTYASWEITQNKSQIEQIKVFRRHDLINIDYRKSFKYYDLIAFEYDHPSDFLRKMRARLIYKMHMNLG